MRREATSIIGKNNHGGDMKAAKHREQQREWQRRNAEYHREYQREWAKRNRDKIRSYAQNSARRAALAEILADREAAAQIQEE